MMAISNSFLPVCNHVPAKEIPQIGHAKPLILQTAKRWSNILENETLDNMCNRRHKKLREARNALSKVRQNDLSESLNMIDALQRLGIEYHFEDEIKAVVENPYTSATATATATNRNHNLSQVALSFRLLRQEGYCVPSDVFNNFKSKDGKFKQELAKDMKGLIGLYEASQLSFDGETILDEAAIFSGNLLNASTEYLDNQQARIVANTLNHPYHRTLPRSGVKNCFHNFQATKSSEYKEIFMEVAKFDFNMLQSFHREELAQIYRWWNDLGLEADQLKLPSSKPLEWIMWPVAGLTDPSLSRQRVELAKVVSLLHLIHNVFDFGGRIDQFTLFVEAVNRWEIDAANALPDHMKICFTVIYNITNEMAFNMYEELGFNPKYSLQKAWARLCNSLLQEAKCLSVGKLPKAEEYLKSCSGVDVVLIYIFFLLGEGITNENVQLVNNDTSSIISSVANVHRLWNEMGSAKGEAKDGSCIKCYMKENPGISEEDTRKHVMKKISDSWKQLNRQCLSPTSFSPSFTKAALNIARLAPFIYAFDHHNHSPIENMKSLLFQNIM